MVGTTKSLSPVANSTYDASYLAGNLQLVVPADLVNVSWYLTNVHPDSYGKVSFRSCRTLVFLGVYRGNLTEFSIKCPLPTLDSK